MLIVPEPAAIWKEYTELVSICMLVSLLLLILSRMLRAAVGRWFYGS